MYCGRDGIEHLGRGRKAEIEHVAQEAAGHAEAGRDVVGSVELRIHDEALPADGGPRFFEIDAHDDHHALAHFGGEFGEAFGIFLPALDVVDAARTNDEQEARVSSPLRMREMSIRAWETSAASCSERGISDTISRGVGSAVLAMT
jgi:hypothetical protein